MFKDILHEATENPKDFNKQGKIPLLEETFKDDPIALKVAYMVATSHEYRKPNVDSAIKFVKDYDWSEDTEKVANLQGIDKPVNKEKAFSIATTIKEKGNSFPLVIVDKLHGVTPQTKGKKILFDGHHRKEALILIGDKETPVYRGKYIGNKNKKNVQELSENAIEEIIESSSKIAPHLRKYVERYHQCKFELNDLNDYLRRADSELQTAIRQRDVAKIKYYKSLVDRYKKDVEILRRECDKLKSRILNESLVDLDGEDILSEASKGKVNKGPLSASEMEEVKKKYGDVECSFHKNLDNGKYFCRTHRARSKYYDSPTDIPEDEVKFVSSTS